MKAIYFALGAVIPPLSTSAQEVSVGEAEFQNSCAQCHGREGRGNGPLADILTQRVADLTQLSTNNDGVFPVTRMYTVIREGGSVGGHGTNEMPAWGQRFNAQAPQELGYYYGPGDQEAYVNGRILALIEYIASLQE